MSVPLFPAVRCKNRDYLVNPNTFFRKNEKLLVFLAYFPVIVFPKGFNYKKSHFSWGMTAFIV